MRLVGAGDQSEIENLLLGERIRWIIDSLDIVDSRAHGMSILSSRHDGRSSQTKLLPRTSPYHINICTFIKSHSFFLLFVMSVQPVLHTPGCVYTSTLTDLGTFSPSRVRARL